MTDTRNRGGVSDTKINEDASRALRDIFNRASKDRDMPFDSQIISELKKKLGDEKVVDAAYEYYKKRLEQIKEKAQKFKSALFRKYSTMIDTIDTRVLIEKAKKFSKKYDFNDSEFNMFMKLLMSDKTQSAWNAYNIPATPMSKTLGYSTIAMGDRLQVDESETGDLKIILEKDKEYEVLHKQLILQSFIFRDMQPHSLIGKFLHGINNVYKNIHPVVAALFLIKNPILEERMLLSSLAGIVKTKYDGRPIITKYDYETYWDLITDPNQTACVVDTSKTVADLKNRVLLQTKLWEVVMNLRNAKYYADESNEFIARLESCNNNFFDAPDLIHTHDEGALLKRLLNVFSLRPTYINTAYMAGMPLGSNAGSLAASYSHTTTLPVVTLRIPSRQSDADAVSMKVTDAINQPQWFLEGKNLVPRTIKIVFSRDVLFFYVNRRNKSVDRTYVNRPYIFAAFPASQSGLDKLNDTEVVADAVISIEGEAFDLRSIVCSMTTTINEKDKPLNVITGCAALLIPTSKGKVEWGGASHYLYYPSNADTYRRVKDGSDDKYIDMSPVMTLPRSGTAGCFEDLSTRSGTIYVYCKRKLADE